MGALGTVVAAGLVSLLLLACFSVYMTATSEASSLQLQAAADQAALASASMNQKVQIDSVKVVNQTFVALSLTNTGQVPIQVTSLPQMDVILVYTAASNGTDRAVWVPYATGPSEGWAVISVTAAGGSVKLVNPMNCPYPTYGAWDSSEVVNIVVLLSPSNAINATDSFAVLVSTPAGTTATGGT